MRALIVAGVDLYPDFDRSHGEIAVTQYLAQMATYMFDTVAVLHPIDAPIYNAEPYPGVKMVREDFKPTGGDWVLIFNSYLPPNIEDILKKWNPVASMYHHFAPWGGDEDPGDLLDATVCWNPMWRDMAPFAEGRPLYEYSLHIPCRMYLKDRSWMFLGAGASMRSDSRLDLLLDAYLRLSRKKQQTVVLGRCLPLLNGYYDEEPEGRAYQEKVAQKLQDIPTCILLPNVQQSVAAKYRNAATLFCDPSSDRLSVMVQEALCGSSQIMRMPSMNQKWIDDEDVMTMPVALERGDDEEAMTQWFFDMLDTFEPLGYETWAKYRDRHSLFSSSRSFREVLSQLGVDV
jgi:hypothetical protein